MATNVKTVVPLDELELSRIRCLPGPVHPRTTAGAKRKVEMQDTKDEAQEKT